MTEQFPYEDIVELPPHISPKYPQPTMMERAARFAPFAAITGYEEMVLEEARVTEERAELDEDAKARLNERLSFLVEHLSEEPEVTITYFEPDPRKSGGEYIRYIGAVRKIDVYRHLVILADGKSVPIDHIYDISEIGAV